MYLFGALVSNVLAEYEAPSNYVSRKIKQIPEFPFCSNKRPSGQPKQCQANGGYPDDLNLDTTSSTDYAQYQAARALAPCFNKEMDENDFEAEEKFRIIDIFTENNFYSRHGRYGDIKRQDVLNTNCGKGPNAVKVIFEEPESRMALINYLK